VPDSSVQDEWNDTIFCKGTQKKSIVRATAEGSVEEVAAALMHPQIKKFVFEELLRSLDGECENLCRPSTQSLLRQKTVEQLPSFSWETFVDEALKVKCSKIGPSKIISLNKRN